MKPHEQSSVGDCDDVTGIPSRHPPLDHVIQLLDEREVCGIVWFDATLVTRARFGRLAEFVALDMPVTHAVLALYGLDEQIHALRRMPDRAVEVPNAAIHTTEGSTPKLNFNIYWLPEHRTYVMLISRVLSRSDLEVELSNQARQRTILEAAMIEKSREIERANRDLAEFTSIISHDLGAPIRAIRYAADDLGVAVGMRPDSEVSALIEEMRAQTQRVSTMLGSLLTYSRIGRKVDAVEWVDTSSLVQLIARSLRPPRGMEIRIEGDWPIVATFAAPLDLILRNLIDNAIKHHDREAGLIRVIGICERDKLFRIEIADDGPGIPADHQALVFQPFVRLKGEQGQDGSGMGLPLVRRTIEQLGGAISLESRPETARGTTFTVEWPLSDPPVTLETFGRERDAPIPSGSGE